MTIKQLPSPQTGIPEVDRVLNEHVNKLNPMLRALPSAANGQLLQMKWLPLTPINGWTAWSPTIDNIFFSPAYMLDTQGFVHLRGLLRNNAGNAGGTTAFVLPVGFRPAARALCSSMGASAVRMDIGTDGSAVFPGAVGAGAAQSLDGITFDTRL